MKLIELSTRSRGSDMAGYRDRQKGPDCLCGDPTFVVFLPDTKGYGLMCLFHTNAEGVMFSLPSEPPPSWPENMSPDALSALFDRGIIEDWDIDEADYLQRAGVPELEDRKKWLMMHPDDHPEAEECRERVKELEAREDFRVRYGKPKEQAEAPEAQELVLHRDASCDPPDSGN